MSPQDERDPGEVRPYAMTGGRTRPADPDLAVEALVSTTALGEARSGDLRLEWRWIVTLCRDVLSVAEVAARLDVPLGVARVLVADMAEEGLVGIFRPPGGTNGDRPDPSLLARVLAGLQTI
jgi:Protein of unknown function (DUF742)